jgi:dihydrolipoamide dehydrogenase
LIAARRFRERGGRTPEQRTAAWHEAVAVRNERVKHLRDEDAVAELERVGVEIVRGSGTIAQEGTVAAAGRSLRYRNLLVSTGAEATLPPIEGLKDVDPWTSDSALTSDELPRSLVILGGGAIGVELAQVYSTFGSSVVVVESADRLLVGEEPEVSQAVAELLSTSGVKVLTGATVTSVTSQAGTAVLHLEGMSDIVGDRVLVATGRRPRLTGYGLEHLGVDTSASALTTGADCRVLGLHNVYAAGDVTGRFPFTHTANYAGRIVATNVLGDPAQMNLEAVPRAVYTTPTVAGVGLSTAQATERRLDVVRATMDVGGTARAWLEDSGGTLVLVADCARRTVVGASAVGPHAEEWIAQATLAVRAQVPVDVLVDTIQPFPAVSEALFPAYERLVSQLGSAA